MTDEVNQGGNAVDRASNAVREYLFGNTGFCTTEDDDGGRVMACYGGNWIYLDPAAIAQSVLAALQSTPPAPELNKSAIDPANSTQGLATPAQPTADAVERAETEAYELGKEDGWSEAVQWIDERTGGDGEYSASTIPGRGCPGPVEMRERIVERFDAQSTMAGDCVMVPNLLSAFRTTVSGDGKYEMVFRFKSMEAMHAADDEWRWMRNEKLGRNLRPVMEIEKLVSKFTDALRVKLAKAETKYGYNDEWLTTDWEAVCKSELARHVAKGDPLDVAAYAAFCWARGWTTAPSPEPAETNEGQLS